MSSLYVRTEIQSYLATELPGETFLDLTARFDEWTDFLDNNSIDHDTQWFGLQFIADPERPITIQATNTQGKYREEGLILLHIVEPLLPTEQATMVSNMLTRSETIKNLFRGKRIGDIIIEAVSQPNFESGATLEFTGGFQACTIQIDYQRDLDL